MPYMSRRINNKVFLKPTKKVIGETIKAVPDSFNESSLVEATKNDQNDTLLLMIINVLPMCHT